MAKSAKTRKKHIKTEYEKNLSSYRKHSDRHVVVIEVDMEENDKRHLFAENDCLRNCGNDLIRVMKHNLEQLLRTKRYRQLQTRYGTLSDRIKALSEKESLSPKQTVELERLTANQSAIVQSMDEMQEQYHVTWDCCRQSMEEIKDRYQATSIFALSRAEDVWDAISRVLYSDGKMIHFRKYGDLPEMRAKQANRGIIVSGKHGKLMIRYQKKEYALMVDPKDLWLNEEITAIIAYLKDPNLCDGTAVNAYLKDKTIISTYRPCYASFVCKVIRGKLRIYIHITVEGKSIPKKKKDGTPRHTLGTGVVGCDIGTQTIAYTSSSEVGLENLAERGRSIRHIERQERLILRAMDRSRRAMNPQNYHPDGTIKKGKKIWKCSRHYQKLKKRYQNLCRIAAENREYAINEQVNHLRSLGDTFITEPKNAKKLQKRANPEEPLDKNGKPKKKKRFGKSIKNRCPGYFQAQVKKVFEATGGTYKEIPSQYRASQYDHTADDYIKKKLSQRIFNLTDGTTVQRDWYSSFLLYCADAARETINRQKCLAAFSILYPKERAMVASIARSGKHVFNSGIRAAHA